MGGDLSMDLRDTETELLIPTNISRFISNFILAKYNGSFYPCIILRPAAIIKDGYTVYFFHFKGETEVPSNSIIGNLMCLINCDVSYVDAKGTICTGRVVYTDFKHQDPAFDQPMNFFICSKNGCTWVSFPYIFMTREQARVICC